jgi:hypothetical protein
MTGEESLTNRWESFPPVPASQRAYPHTLLTKRETAMLERRAMAEITTQKLLTGDLMNAVVIVVKSRMLCSPFRSGQAAIKVGVSHRGLTAAGHRHLHWAQLNCTIVKRSVSIRVTRKQPLHFKHRLTSCSTSNGIILSPQVVV